MWLVTPIYKPVRPFIGGITLFMDLLTMVSLLTLCIGGISVACFFSAQLAPQSGVTCIKGLVFRRISADRFGRFS